MKKKIVRERKGHGGRYGRYGRERKRGGGSGPGKKIRSASMMTCTFLKNLVAACTRYVCVSYARACGVQPIELSARVSTGDVQKWILKDGLGQSCDSRPPSNLLCWLMYFVSRNYIVPTIRFPVTRPDPNNRADARAW